MAIDYDRLVNWRFADVEHEFTKKDAILYALGVGLGHDPTDLQQLRFVYEEGLEALPSFGGVLGYPGFWAKDPVFGIDWKRVLNGEQGIVLHRPLPVEGKVVGRLKIDAIVDKGADKGALIYTSRDVVDAASGAPLCTVTNTLFCRGNGGFGGPSGPVKAPSPVPERAPDLVCDLPTVPQAALIYRLSGDYNPLHADPAVARAGGFPRPILHGAASWAIAGHALLKTLCDYDPARFRRLDVRFSAPVFPGETIRVEIWKTGPGKAAFRARVVERDVVALNNGAFEYGGA
jgi:acyl dehydratase